MDVIHQLKKFEKSLFNSEELWTITKTTVDIVKTIGKKADKGIWDLQTEEQHFTFKLLCWVADRE
jgi:hypothetical protein